MLDFTPALLPLLGPLARFIPGVVLHQRALRYAAASRPEHALACLEAALFAYRRELAIEPIARLRVHELMLRARAGGIHAGESPEILEIVQRLNRLDRLESLNAPHDLRDAREVLAEWIEGGGAPARAAHWPEADTASAVAA